MKLSTVTGSTAALASTAQALSSTASLFDVCTSSYVQAAMPGNDSYPGVTLLPSTATANAVYNASLTDSVMFPDAVVSYCNVTFQYTHNGLDDAVIVQYCMPTPAAFENRYLSNGGGAYDIYPGSGVLPGGVSYGAVSGATDGGFGGFRMGADSVFLVENGTVNWQSLFMFGYEAHHELSTIGKLFTRSFYDMANGTKLYAYYEGCSEGGREGWSQVQRYGDEWDGAVVGAPAMRFSQQQIFHLHNNVVEKTLGYVAPPCELEIIRNLTIDACDPLDGKTDGVVSRSDLCKLHFNINSTIGTPYYCAASAGSSMGGGGATPAQNGTISAAGVAVAQTVLAGLHDSKGRRAYINYQPASDFGDALISYNSTSDTWEISMSPIGGEFVTRYIYLRDSSELLTLDGVTYDTLVSWMWQGWQKYEDTLQTTWPDLTPFQEAGGKVLHYHGEADSSVPTASSVTYWNSVRRIMYPGTSFNESSDALGDWYRFFIVPGAGHCNINDIQPNHPYPQTTLGVMIDWVENGVTPETLNATVLQGENYGEQEQLCAFPLRPLWTAAAGGNASEEVMECVYDQASVDSWLYEFPAFKLPMY